MSVSEGPVFSPRVCPGCGVKVPGQRFGRHLMAHDWRTFPGGVIGMLNALIESVELSLVEAEGYPDVLEGLTHTAGAIEELRKIEVRLGG